MMTERNVLFIEVSI